MVQLTGQASAALCCCLLTAGCGVSPLATRVSAFGAAASLIAKDSSASYDTVERTVYNAEVSSLVLDFDTKGFDPAGIKPFLSGEDLAARHSMLDALQHYATFLQDVGGNAPLDAVNTATAELGQRLHSLSTNSALAKLKANDDEVKGLTTAIDAAGQLLVERKHQKALPPIVTAMQGVIDRICALLDADLGSAPNAEGIGGRGLRLQLWTEYDRLIVNQKTWLDRNKTTLPPQEKADGIAKLPALVKEQRAADDTLVATQNALKDLAKTHRALLTEHKRGTSFFTYVAEMKDDAERIAGFYNSLNFKVATQ